MQQIAKSAVTGICGNMVKLINRQKTVVEISIIQLIVSKSERGMSTY